jgi:ribonuclease BN (tRNA processing enzyme)
VDVLLAEAAFLDGTDLPTGVHLTGRQAAEAAQAAGVGSLVVTHIPPWHDPQRVLAEAAPHFSGDTSLAVTDAVLTISPR